MSETLDNFVEKVINTLRDDEALGHEFGIQGRVTFYDRATPSETLLENSLEQMNLQGRGHPKGRRTLGMEETKEERGEQRRGGREMALHEDATDAPTNSACTL